MKNRSAIDPRLALRNRVKLTLKDRNLTQRELARRLGISEPALSMKISGVTRVSLEQALELEKHTGIPARDFAQR